MKKVKKIKKIKPGSLLRLKRGWWSPRRSSKFAFVVSRGRSTRASPENGVIVHWPNGTRGFYYDDDVGDVGQDNLFELILEPK